MSDSIQAYCGYDRRKTVKWLLTLFAADPRNIVTGKTYKMLDDAGNARDVRVTSVKTWKRRPEVQVSLKYGMYEFFKVKSTDGKHWDGESIYELDRTEQVSTK